MKKYLSVLVLLFLVACQPKAEKEIVITEVEISDPLPSWNEGATKSAIINYVSETVNRESENFVPVSKRIATFDNDANLWREQPMCFQLFFCN